jgi:hypothetical protein
MELTKVTYHALHAADQETVEDLTGLVGVADILKGLGAVLAADIQKDFLTTAVEQCQ